MARIVRAFVYRDGLAAKGRQAHELAIDPGASIEGGGGGGRPQLLEALKAQIESLTGIAPADQCIVYGEAAFPIRVEADLRGLVLHDHDHDHDQDHEHQPVPPSLHVMRRQDLVAWREETTCTRVFLGSDRPVLQPIYVLPGSDKGICHGCSQLCFPEGLLVAQAGGPLKPFVCAAEELCAEGLGTYLFAERLHEAQAILGGDDDKGAASVRSIEQQSSEQPQPKVLVPPAARALLSVLEEQAIAQQALGFAAGGVEAAHMAARLRSGHETVTTYESPHLQNKALSVIPLAALHARAVAAGGDPQRRPLAYRDLLFRELLAWFKRDFFKWVNAPPCDGCGRETTLVGGAAPTPAEAAGKAGRVEVYRCNGCQGITRFPRYNDPGVLLDTRRGRCGEWANCFGLCARAVGFDTRYCLDFTDHVWVEVWSEAEARWMHADSCENACDSPLMYEQGWGKKLTYVLAFSKDACVDVTRRYTRRYHEELLARRTEVPELVLARQVASLNGFIRQSRQPQEDEAGEARLRREQYELHHHTVLGEAHRLPLKPSELRGRISGDAVWKRLRGEDGRGAPGVAATTTDTDPCLVATCAVPPVAAAAITVPLEREDLAGLPLWPFVAAAGDEATAVAPSLLVAVTSIGAGDLGGGGGGGALASFGSDAITINGLPVAVGSRGLNLAVVDLSQGVLERSVAFDTAVAGDGESASPSPVQEAVNAFIVQLPPGRLVVATVLGSGHGLTQGTETWGSAAGGGGFSPAAPAPGRGRAWLVVGETGGSAAASLQPWALSESREEGRGPARVVVAVPLRLGASGTTDEVKVWDGGIATLPLLHDVGVAGDPDQAFMRLRTAFPRAPMVGYSYKPRGFGLVAFGPTSAVRGGDGWATTRRCAGLPGAPDKAEVMRAKIKAAFDRLVAQGAAPNVAAVQALAAVKQEQEQEAQGGGGGGGIRLIWSEQVGGTVRPADGEAWAFDDADAAFPFQAAAERGQLYPPRRLAALRLWGSPRGVTALQAGYAAETAGEEAAIAWAPLHKPATDGSGPLAGEPPSAQLKLAPGERIAKVELRRGEDGIEALRLTTDRGQRVACGKGEPPTTALQLSAPEQAGGAHVVAFFGTFRRSGLQSLGVVQARVLAAASTASPREEDYSACPVDRAVGLMLQWARGADDNANTTAAAQKVRKALEAARKYLANSANEPANAKFRLIRVRSKFFADHIAHVPGSGHLMAALGFEHVAAVAEGAVGAGNDNGTAAAAAAEACYRLPLRSTSPATLRRLMARVDANLARVAAALDAK